MPNYKSRSELKALARLQLQGKTGTLIGALLIQVGLVFAVTLFPSILIPTNNVTNLVIYNVLIFILQLIFGILQAGVCYLYLKAACGMPFGISDMFYCFQNSPNRIIAIQFILTLINVVCMLPFDILSWQYPISVEDYDLLLILLGIESLCMLINEIVTLCFAPVFYMLLDFPDYSVKEVLVESVKVMKGNKLRYFLLQLSFIPLMMTTFFTCGITMLWIIPYVNMTNTNFYLDLMSNRNREM